MPSQPWKGRKMKIIMTTLAALALSAGIAAANNADGGCDYNRTGADTTQTPVVPAEPSDA